MTKKKQKYQIVWEKWRNPYTEQPDTQDFNTEEDESLAYNDEEHERGGEIQQSHAILTPLGIVPINEYTDASKIFNFWIGHANFNLSLDLIKIIESIQGVETLNIFTRYRFRIGIGKLFKSGEVMHNIEQAVTRFLGGIDGGSI